MFSSYRPFKEVLIIVSPDYVGKELLVKPIISLVLYVAKVIVLPYRNVAETGTTNTLHTSSA